jgi:transcriptional regulator with XRE-family HTH domain
VDAITYGSVGERVRRLRKLRGMTQQDLRRASGLGLHTVKDVEAGHGNPRNDTLHKIARGLQVRTSDLATPGEPEYQPVPGEPWEDVRDALYRRSPQPEPGEPATPAGVLTGLADLTPAWRAAEYSQVRLVLPGLVRDAMSLNGSEEDRGAKSRALSATAWMLNMTRQFDDAWAAARLALDAAPGLPDTLAAVSMMCWCLLRQGRSAEAGALAVEWADKAEPRFSRATTGELAGYGKMLLYIANAMATDNQPGEAADALSLARAAAARIGRDVPFSVATTARFGPSTVTVIAAESAALNWQPKKTLALAERVRGSLAVIEPAQQLRHRLDVASAHAMRREYAEVVGVMQGLQREAPEWLGSQQYARDILEGIIRRRRGPWTQELRDLAAATRLPL